MLSESLSLFNSAFHSFTIFVDFLLSPESQEHFTNNTFEFPMISGVSPSPLVVNNLGLDFKQDLKTKVSTYGKNQAAALEVMTAAGWK